MKLTVDIHEVDLPSQMYYTNEWPKRQPFPPIGSKVTMYLIPAGETLGASWTFIVRKLHIVYDEKCVVLSVTINVTIGVYE